MPEIHTLIDATTTARAIETAGAALDAGGVVLVPTDTVYGLACRAAFPAAVDRIFAMKGRPADKRLPYLLADAEQVETFVNSVPRRARRLMARFWPGALTLVLGAEGRTVALRVPDHEALRAVLRRAAGPVQATSANKSGEPATVRFEEAFAAVGAHVDVAIDGGTASRSRESTLVQVTDDGVVTVLREGAISRDALRTEVPFTILVVCTGNTCRSPMAAAVLTNALANTLSVPPPALESAGFRVLSAGVSAIDGFPASHGARQVVGRLGLDLSAHRSKALTSRAVDDADLVLVLTTEHRGRVQSLVRGAMPPPVELLDPSGKDIPDPFGGGPQEYAACLDAIAAAVASRLPGLVSRN